VLHVDADFTSLRRVQVSLSSLVVAHGALQRPVSVVHDQPLDGAFRRLLSTNVYINSFMGFDGIRNSTLSYRNNDRARRQSGMKSPPYFHRRKYIRRVNFQGTVYVS
jgi:hypothetical protein